MEEQIASLANAPSLIGLISLNRLIAFFVSEFRANSPSWRTFLRDPGPAETNQNAIDHASTQSSPNDVFVNQTNRSQ